MREKQIELLTASTKHCIMDRVNNLIDEVHKYEENCESTMDVDRIHDDIWYTGNLRKKYSGIIW